MLFDKYLLALAITGFANVAIAQNGGNSNGQNNGGQGQGQGQGAASSTAATATGGAGGESDTLEPDAIQTGSDFTGQQAGASGIKTGQAPAATDNANFINFCSGKTLTNGLQIKTGSCNGIPMGDIPATTNMVSTIITNPKPGDDLAANQDFNVQLQVANINAGFFTNPDVTYYTAPQQLNPQNGNIIGHVHVTIQTLGDNLAPQAAPDASTFVFFKGIDDAGNGNGGLQAAVAGGLPAGSYRVCTMSAAENHQPVTMPVAQRGAQDDCTKFTVGQGNGGNAGGNAGGNQSSAAASGAAASTDAAAGAASSTAAANGQQQGGQQATTTQAAQGAQTTAAQGGQQGATTQAAQGAQTTAAQGGQQGATTQAAQGGQAATTVQAAQGAGASGAAGGQFGDFGGFGGSGGQGGRRKGIEWGPRRHRFQNRPYIV